MTPLSVSQLCSATPFKEKEEELRESIENEEKEFKMKKENLNKKIDETKLALSTTMKSIMESTSDDKNIDKNIQKKSDAQIYTITPDFVNRMQPNILKKLEAIGVNPTLALSSNNLVF